jgi:glycosyltransferase involved in cell wall biosynthesis
VQLAEEWPRISIVTPSLNQSAFVEETLRSVLEQGYPNLEYIVIDGGSSDGSVEIIRRYADRLAYFVSEPDRGQSEAINKGFARATGDLFGWLNSDDLYEPGALEAIATAHRQQPQAILAGDVILIEQRGRAWHEVTRVEQRGLTADHLIHLDGQFAYAQPGLFFPAPLWRELGGVDERLRYAMDHDLLCRAVRRASALYVHRPVARFRLHDDSKTARQWLAQLGEQIAVSRRYWSESGTPDERALQRFFVDAVVRQASTELTHAHVVRAMRLMAVAGRSSPLHTAVATVGHTAAGLQRQARRHLG